MAWGGPDGQINNLGSPTPPSNRGNTVGETKIRKWNGKDYYWEWNGTRWTQIKKEKFEAANPSLTLNYSALSTPSSSGSIRYPSDAGFGDASDYVLFQFYEYQPPFQNINRGATTDSASNPGLAAYNESATSSKLYTKTSGKSIILYMPEDVSTGYKAQWTGKSFSNTGRNILTTAGSGGPLQFAQNTVSSIGQAWESAITNTGAKVVQETIAKITGEDVSTNDIFAGTRGVILNPNVELLFSGIDLRNFALNFKLVARNKGEADDITTIINEFRKAMLPRFSDGKDLPLASAIGNDNNIKANFIKVPNVCKVSFMRGSGLNPNVAQYKMCAITQVDINYTPDGTYAVLKDGQMAAVGLSLSFQETKLIFAEEVEQY